MTQGIDGYNLSPEQHLLWAIYGDNQDICTYDDISVLVQELPRREQELFDFYYIKKMNQKDIAKIIGVTQGAVSSRISKAKKRLVYLKELQEIDFDEFFKDIEGVIEDPLEIDIIRSLLKTSCQSETARRINEKFHLEGPKRMNQVKVRYRFERVLNKLKILGGHSYKFKRHYSTLRKIKENLYMLCEIRLPHFDREK